MQASRLSSVLRKYSYFARKPMFYVVCVFVVIGTMWTFSRLSFFSWNISPEQRQIDNIANYIDIRITTGDNFRGMGYITITLTNKGSSDIEYGPWKIYFYTFIRFVTSKIGELEVRFVSSGLYCLVPIMGKFKGIKPGESVRLYVELAGWKSIAKSDHPPNWYVAADDDANSEPKVIESTKDESLSFVADFEAPNQWKQNPEDAYNPYTPEVRYKNHYRSSVDSNLNKLQKIIPTVLHVEHVADTHVEFSRKWVVVKFVDSQGRSWTNYLAKKLNIYEVNKPSTSTDYIEFKQYKDFAYEEYRIEFTSIHKKIIVISSSEVGAFYASQTILSLLSDSSTIPDSTIHDFPRFKYRGLMIDVARNFFPKETIIKLIDVLAQYKMNTLHLHLTDNEGWRIEIPEIPELARYGSRRCHRYENMKCLPPSLGSGPDKSSKVGFYSVTDFRDILRHAKENHIEVIPEIDIPGHSNAAITAMRYRNTNGQSSVPGVVSLNMLADDTSIDDREATNINPCIEDTYKFIETVLKSLKSIYEGINDLKMVHIGGDEVPHGVWQNSPACKTMLGGKAFDHTAIKKKFMSAVVEIAAGLGLKVAVWEDAIYSRPEGSFNRSGIFNPAEVNVNAWNNVWEYGTGGKAIELADSDYKVVLSLATHLYLDHPYEPDPEERGLYWATRYIDTKKTFGLMPMNIFANADFDKNGKILDPTILCGGRCPIVQKHGNIAGLEACVWTETIRSEEHLHNMLFPRLLAVSERAWHKATWEGTVDKVGRDLEKEADWKVFVETLGYKELPRLDKYGIQYRVPPPGMMFDVNTRILNINTLYPNHDVMVSYGTKDNWQKVGATVQVPLGVRFVHAKSLSPIQKRPSRIIHLHVPSKSTLLQFDRRVLVFSIGCVLVTLIVKFCLVT